MRETIKGAEIASPTDEPKITSIDAAVSEIAAQLRSNLATIRSFFHFLEIGQYNATEQELREMHQKLDGHLETSQAQLMKKLDGLAKWVKEQELKKY